MTSGLTEIAFAEFSLIVCLLFLSFAQGSGSDGEMYEDLDERW